MIEFKKGNKHPNDKIIFINGHQITYKELAKCVIIFCQNEDNIYPKPRFRGGDMLKDFLNECIDVRNVTNDICRKYKI
jgi:hypothetical protein